MQKDQGLVYRKQQDRKKKQQKIDLDSKYQIDNFELKFFSNSAFVKAFPIQKTNQTNYSLYILYTVQWKHYSIYLIYKSSVNQK